MFDRKSPHLWPLLLFWGLLVLASVWTRSYIPIDETRYVTVAWNMWLSGDYLVPFINGAPYHHKPPLLFWLINLGWAAFGVNETWPRLLPALFSLAGALLLRRLARLLWPQRAEVAGLAPLILMSSLLWAIFTTATMFDILLTSFVLTGLIGMVLAGRGDAANVRRGFLLLALGLGGGLLAKGPVVLLHLLPPAVAAPLWAPAWTGRWRGWYGRLLLAFLGGAALVLAWAIPAALAGGEVYAKAIFWGQTANRMVDAFAHKRPFYWYLPFLPLVFFPWLWVPQIWRGLRQLAAQHGLRNDPALRFLLAWLLPIFLFFCLISGKQLHYLLPLFPGAALLFALALAQGRGSRRGAGLLPALPILALAAALLAGWRVPGLIPAAQPPAWSAYALFIVAVFFVAAEFRPWRTVLHLAAGTTLLVALFSLAPLPAAMKALDVRPTAQHLGKLDAAGVPLAFVGEYDGMFDFLGRLRRPLAVLETPPAVQEWCRRHPQGRLVLSVKRGNVPDGAEFAQDYFSRRLAVVAVGSYPPCRVAP